MTAMTNRFFSRYAGLVLLVVAIVMMADIPTANAGRYDGTPWGVGFTGNSEWGPQCEICRAENRRPTMTGCVSSAAQMKANMPYIIYCGGGKWGYNGSAPGTHPVDPGQSVGSHTAGPDDWWTVKD